MSVHMLEYICVSEYNQACVFFCLILLEDITRVPFVGLNLLLQQWLLVSHLGTCE